MSRLRAVLVAAAVLAALIASAAPAAAASSLKVTYRVTGTSTVASTGSKLALGPAVLSLSLRPSGKFTAKLPLPPAPATFKIAGLLPVSATVSFIPKGKVTGTLKGGKRTVVTSTAKDFVKLSDVTVAGLPTFVGDSCQTQDPVVLHVATPAKKSFNLDKGGVLKGGFSIGKFANCGLTTALVNQLIPGDGNTISLHLRDGKLVG
jgi:hypothetical protein